MQYRKLGRSGIDVSAIGLGCWAIGGPYSVVNGEERIPMGWGVVDDRESISAIHRALDLGVNLFDTANAYGAGHSESVLGEALQGRRDSAVVCTKFGVIIDEEAKTVQYGQTMEMSLYAIRTACEGSLRRLRTDYIDLYLLHDGELDPALAPEVMEHLETLVAEGNIRYYGWSTDDHERARIFASGEHCTAIEHRLNVMFNTSEMVDLCLEHDLASIVKSPLNGGFLTGKFTVDTTFPEHDGRKGLDFREGRPAERLRQVEALRPILTGDGRSMTQGALAWILTRSPNAIPIPGFKRAEQVEENVSSLNYGLLREEQMLGVEDVMGRSEGNNV